MTKGDSTNKKSASSSTSHLDYLLDWNAEIPGLESTKDDTSITESTDGDDEFDSIVALHILEQGQALANGQSPPSPVGDFEAQEQPSSSTERPVSAKTSTTCGHSAKAMMYCILAFCAAMGFLALMKHMHQRITAKD
ncbi:MAG: hypothetical protein SGBAC_008168 [Bacillariaceae sp.]